MDTDQDSRGNLCDDDDDGDSVLDKEDLCPLVPDGQQKDKDGDGSGDLCDNCVSQPNMGQHDQDEDGVGDVCDSGNDQDQDSVQARNACTSQCAIYNGKPLP